MKGYSGRYIRWRLDEGAVEPYDPLGDFFIQGEDGCVEERETLLDTYLVTLSEGVRRLQTEPRVPVDVVVEPYAFSLERQGTGMAVGYRGHVARIGSIDAFRADLVAAARTLVEVLDAEAARLGTEKPLMTGLREVMSFLKVPLHDAEVTGVRMDRQKQLLQLDLVLHTGEAVWLDFQGAEEWSLSGLGARNVPAPRRPAPCAFRPGSHLNPQQPCLGRPVAVQWCTNQ
ncbi:hypothetical protein [Corallococcus aberystwythensis]|uniref:Uncharacterized protein n=1 Tax=Corallococcus aberystwythensis TaxID=2316722 RepID=A0A3A8PXJ0_9BACT|nr:hypothetical protein [Corallococcus aberystwythensis]RKH56104.1 hypothetical protein D7W81_34770 [Corallococcus aberystwythensis]